MTKKKDNYIFVIGLNKTATRTIHNIFENNNYAALHWGTKKTENLVKKRIENKKPPLSKDLENRYQVFSDIQNLSSNFDVLDKKYPDSLFIFNYRSLDSWILSRLNHQAGNYINHWRKQHNLTKLSVNQVIDEWRNLYNNHYTRVKDYFKNKDNIVYYNIEKESLQEFISKVNEKISKKLDTTKEYKIAHITKQKKWILKDDEFIKII